jgi:hypothetical protein
MRYCFRCNKIKRNHASKHVAFIADVEPNRDFTQQRIVRDIVRLRLIVTGGVIVACKFDTLQGSQAFPDLHERGAFMGSDPRPAGRIIDDASRGGSERICHIAGYNLGDQIVPQNLYLVIINQSCESRT